MAFVYVLCYLLTENKCRNTQKQQVTCKLLNTLVCFCVISNLFYVSEGINEYILKNKRKMYDKYGANGI